MLYNVLNSLKCSYEAISLHCTLDIKCKTEYNTTKTLISKKKIYIYIYKQYSNTD